MVTDIFGGIEVRDPRPFDGPPWIKAMDLDLLLDGGGPVGAYPAFAYLFGVRNQYGFKPIAESRGLPTDVSAAMLDALEPTSDFVSISWVAWSELMSLDLDGPFGHVVGHLEWSDGSALVRSRLVPAAPTTDELAFAGPTAATLNLTEASDWEHDGFVYRYRPMTLGTYFGPTLPWGHVFAVMHALAGRFGDDGVRLVAAFDD